MTVFIPAWGGALPTWGNALPAWGNALFRLGQCTLLGMHSAGRVGAPLALSFKEARGSSPGPGSACATSGTGLAGPPVGVGVVRGRLAAEIG